MRRRRPVSPVPDVENAADEIKYVQNAMRDDQEGSVVELLRISQGSTARGGQQEGWFGAVYRALPELSGEEKKRS